jgi:hypothetical protein
MTRRREAEVPLYSLCLIAFFNESDISLLAGGSTVASRANFKINFALQGEDMSDCVRASGQTRATHKSGVNNFLYLYRAQNRPADCQIWQDFFFARTSSRSRNGKVRGAVLD